MSKTLEQWLNSSSSSDDDPKATTPFSKPPGRAPASRARSPSQASTSSIPRSSESPTASRRAPAPKNAEAEERRKKLEEMRNRMKGVLGDEVVEKVTSAVQSSQKVRDSNQSSMGGYSSDFVADSQNTSSLPAHLPPLSKVGEESRQLAGVRYEEVESMVVDRGCQTICEVECQTDPDPVVTSCAMCYKQTYGHTHGSFFGCGHHQQATGCVPAMISGDPYFERILQRAELIGAAAAFGTNNRPEPIHMHAYPASYPAAVTSAAAAPQGSWRDQLSFLEGSIDMLINRYNLPPPAGMEHLRPR